MDSSSPPIRPHERTWGTPHTPIARYRSEQACQYVDDCLAAIDLWIAAALTGCKRHPLESENHRGILRAADSIRADVAQVLADTPIWDGFLLAAALLHRGWPADLALAHMLHSWSCEIRQRRIAAASTR